jgi:hypothetical protein
VWTERKGSQIIHHLCAFPTATPALDKASYGGGTTKADDDSEQFQGHNLARMHIGATCHKTVRCVQSETDLIGMDTVDRSVHYRYFDAVPYTFKPNLKNSGNPVHDKMPVKLRLTGSVSWLASDRSDENQRLTAKVLIEWSEALLKDLKRLALVGQTSTPRELLRMRAVHHNILVDERSWDAQTELIRSTTDSPFSYCIHPTGHVDAYKDTENTVAEHKIACWTGNPNN